MITWSIPNQLARSPRPGNTSIPAKEKQVAEWIAEAEGMGIKSIICLLSEQELYDYYSYVGIDLLDLYRKAGFEVGHFPVSDCFTPRQAVEILPQIEKFYQSSPKPCLVHCSAGIDRTGTVIKYLKRLDANSSRSGPSL